MKNAKKKPSAFTPPKAIDGPTACFADRLRPEGRGRLTTDNSFHNFPIARIRDRVICSISAASAILVPFFRT